MAKPHNVNTLSLEPRTELGTTGARHIRAAGRIPGVVYGHGQSTPISIDAKELADLILSGARSHIVQASIGKDKDSVLLRRVEADPITRKPLSVDFQRVKRGESIVATVPIVTTGTPLGVRESGAVMDVVTHALEIRGPVQSIPEALTVDVYNLDIHEHITAAQVPLPKGFTLLTPPETIVVSVEITRAIAGAGPEEEIPTEAPQGE
jgi:large subunit ribosomal protein L25